MRKVSPNLLAIGGSPNVTPFYLLEIKLSDGTIFREADKNFPITIPGVGTFGASSGLIEYESPRQSSAVDREAYKITYIDPTFQFRAHFEAGLTGARVTAYLGLFNSTAYPMISGGVSIPPGQPLTGLEDLIVAYSGWVDTQGYTIDPDSGTVVAVLEGASPMASLDMSKPFRTTREDMKTVNLNDTSFDEIYTGVSRVSYAWGKAAPGSGQT